MTVSRRHNHLFGNDFSDHTVEHVGQRENGGRRFTEMAVRKPAATRGSTLEVFEWRDVLCPLSPSRG